MRDLVDVERWVYSHEPTLDLRGPLRTKAVPALRGKKEVLSWTLGGQLDLQSGIASGLKRKVKFSHRLLRGFSWSYVGGFLREGGFETPIEVQANAKLYGLVMEMRFRYLERQPLPKLYEAFGDLSQYLDDNPLESLLLYRWCHVNEYVSRTVLLFDSYDHASPDEAATVTKVLAHAGPALGVIRGLS